VEQLGGTIQMSSQYDIGTKISFNIKLSQDSSHNEEVKTVIEESKHLNEELKSEISDNESQNTSGIGQSNILKLISDSGSKYCKFTQNISKLIN
jgi:hypothetical protein